MARQRLGHDLGQQGGRRNARAVLLFGTFVQLRARFIEARHVDAGREIDMRHSLVAGRQALGDRAPLSLQRNNLVSRLPEPQPQPA